MAGEGGMTLALVWGRVNQACRSCLTVDIGELVMEKNEIIIWG